MTIIRHGAIVAGAQIADTAMNLARTMLLARLLTVEQFGIASTFSILMTLIDATQNAGIDRMLVQSREVVNGRMQATLQSAQLAMGIGSGVIILAISWPYSLVMGTSGMAIAFLIFAALPVVRSFQNLDMFRLQREDRFMPTIVTTLCAQAVSVAAIWPLYLLFGDYRVAVGSIVIFHCAALAISHLGAERSIRFARDPEVLRDARSFGLPILINGLFLFFVMNGDRMVVSFRFGHEVLGAFSAATLLAMTPTLVMARVFQTLFLPRMARAQDDQVRLQALYDGASDGTIVLAVFIVLGTALLGAPVLLLLFGPKYAPAAPYLLLLVVMQSIRFVRAAPAVVAMARAETRNPLYANIVRGAFIPLAWGVAVATGSIYALILTGLIGEVVAAFSAAFFVRKMIGLEIGHFARSLLAALLIMAALLGHSLMGLPWWLFLVPLVLLVVQVRHLAVVLRS